LKKAALSGLFNYMLYDIRTYKKGVKLGMEINGISLFKDRSFFILKGGF